IIEAWREAEKAAPHLYIILDQFEEVFRRAAEADSPEWHEFVTAVTDLNKEPHPRGKLILGFQEEYYTSVSTDLCGRVGLAALQLKPLTTEGVVEAVLGPTLTDDLREQYGLTVDPELPTRIAFDLIGDRHSPLAPTLQLLLIRMHTDAKALAPTEPRLT